MSESKKFWKFLKPGDLIDVVAPASSCGDFELKLGLEAFAQKGFRYRLQAPLFRRTKYLSHHDEKRWSDLKKALLAPDSAGVWCVRGGYGAARLLPFLEELAPPKQCKLFVGLSDITALHVFLNQAWGWPTLFAPILTRMGSQKASSREKRETWQVVTGDGPQVLFKNLKAWNAPAQKIQDLAAPVVGGNLTLVQSLTGTPYQLSANKLILFLEDVGERGYRLDRALQQMKQAGVFDGCRAIVLGDFVGGEEPDGGSTVRWTLRQFFETLKVPVFAGLKAGHGSLQRPVPLMTGARLAKMGAAYQLTISSGGRPR